MNHSKSIAKFFLIPCLSIFLIQCLLDGKKDKKSSVTNNGNFVFTYPYDKQVVSYDTSLTITWYTKKNNIDRIKLELYQDSQFVDVISSNISNSGKYAWRVNPESGSGEKYQIKITNAEDSSQYDYSGFFKIKSLYDGTISVTSPTLDDEAMIGEPLSIEWNTAGETGSQVSIKLYKDSTLVQTIISSTANDGSHSWSGINTTLGSGDDYYIEIASVQDGGIFGLSEKFSILSEYDGTITITAPEASEELESGSIYEILWETEGNIGTGVSIKLVKNEEQILSLTTNSSDDGSQSWSIPAYLETGDNYQIEIASVQDPGLKFYSEEFTINGLEKDKHEPDSSKETATTIDFKITESHSLTLNDEDWVKFSADSGNMYIISTSNNIQINKEIYNESEDDPIASISYSIYSTIWEAPEDGIFFVRIYGRNSSSYGNYSLAIREYNPDSIVTFVNPSEASAWVAGTEYNIQWKADSAIFGNAVRLTLMKNDEELMDISTAIENNGQISWSLPGGLETGNDYKIKLENSTNSQIFGYSSEFTIAGINKDKFEPNNSPEEVAEINSDGEEHELSLTANDQDWFIFSAKENTYYAISIVGDVNVRAYVYPESTTTSLEYQTGTNIQIFHQNEEAQKLRLRIYGLSSSYFGDYNLIIREYDPENVLNFANPTTESTWSTGSQYDIQWTPDSTLFGSLVRIFLMQDSLQLLSIASSSNNSGNYSWTIPNGMATGNNYQIKIVNYSNQNISALSEKFSISGIAQDKYEQNNTKENGKELLTDGSAQGASISYQDEDWFYFQVQAQKTYVINISSEFSIRGYLQPESSTTQLDYKTGTNIQMVYTNTSEEYLFLRTLPVSSSYFGMYDIAIVEHDPAENMFTNPTSSATWSTGSPYDIQWDTDSLLFGSHVRLTLMYNQKAIATISSRANNNGEFSYTPPDGLASSDKYSILMENYANTNIKSYSEGFAISGIPLDSYEIDDSASLAHELQSGVEESHSLSLSDVDWFFISASPDNIYSFTVTGSIYPRLNLYSDEGLTSLAQVNTSGLDSNVTFSWFNASGTELYLKLESSRRGSYNIELNEISSGDVQLNVSAPIAGSDFSAGDSVSITWDTQVDLGGRVDLFLYNSGGVVETISANVVNSGEHIWVVPASTTAGTEYFIRVISRISGNIFGNSDVFSISN